jgi:hypothetical protein
MPPSPSSTAAISTLTPQELSNVLLDPHTAIPVSRSFQCYPTSTMALRQYSFLSHSIITLEEELERHQLEREQIFDHLMRGRIFRRKIQPIVTNHRQMTPRRTRFHPYGHMSSPSPSPVSSAPSLDGSIESSKSIKILPEEALARNSTPSVTHSVDASPGSFYTPTHGRPPSPPTPPSFNNYINSPSHVEVITNDPCALSPHSRDLITGIDEEINRVGSMTNIVYDDEESESGVVLGSELNPIVIRDDKDVCPRCNQQGHQQEDCGTPMRSFQHCEICAWTKQTLCDHVDPSPAWLKELKTNFEKRNH